jgi:hypothetical protein
VGRHIVDQAHLRAIRLSLGGNTEGAARLLEQTKQRLVRLDSVTGRLYYLGFCALVVLLVAIVAIVVTAIGSANSELVTWSYVALFGSLGGFLSVASGLDRLELDPAAWYVNAASGCSRIVIAVIGAWFVYLLIRAEIIFGTITQLQSIWAVLALSVVAGFSETYVPNLLRKAESGQGGDLAQNQPGPAPSEETAETDRSSE